MSLSSPKDYWWVNNHSTTSLQPQGRECCNTSASNNNRNNHSGDHGGRTAKTGVHTICSTFSISCSCDQVQALSKQCCDLFAEKPRTPTAETLGKLATFRKDCSEQKTMASSVLLFVFLFGSVIFASSRGHGGCQKGEPNGQGLDA